MSAESNATPRPPLESPVFAPAVVPASRRMYWSVRRELWESRSIYAAPLAVAGLILVGFLISTAHLRESMRAALALNAARQHEAVEQPYTFASLVLMATTFVVAVFYCLDALHAERRDRSILFWKSMPVSDLTTVLAKVSIPLVVLPLLTLTITVVTQAIMALLSTVVLLGTGPSVAALRSDLSLSRTWLMLLYHLLAIHALWFAPIYGWLLLVSGWARRAPVLWAVLPLLAVALVERIAFNTSHFTEMLTYRFGGGPEIPFTAGGMPMERVTVLTVGGFLRSPDLWIGLATAAAFLAAAVRLRRYRSPI